MGTGLHGQGHRNSRIREAGLETVVSARRICSEVGAGSFVIGSLSYSSTLPAKNTMTSSSASPLLPTTILRNRSFFLAWLVLPTPLSLSRHDVPIAPIANEGNLPILY